jgi:hypothetical protein
MAALQRNRHIRETLPERHGEGIIGRRRQHAPHTSSFDFRLSKPIKHLNNISKTTIAIILQTNACLTLKEINPRSDKPLGTVVVRIHRIDIICIIRKGSFTLILIRRPP